MVELSIKQENAASSRIIIIREINLLLQQLIDTIQITSAKPYAKVQINYTS
ncbi:MAG: hypothetical protein UFA98_01410 [Ruminococcus sp.]|nr:hypothetical protein [Ruminococcus sp.]